MLDVEKYFGQYKIGNTPLLKIDSDSTSASIYAKCEWENCFGSIKDRVAVALIKDAVLRFPELLEPEKGYSIIEYTGGNLGLALAKICKDLRVSLELVLPGGASFELIKSLEQLNVKISLVDRSKGFFGIIQEAKRMARQNKKRVLLYQHRNQENIKCHLMQTAAEIIRDTSCPIDAYVASIGTGASLIGTYLGLKQIFPEISLYAVSPKEMPYGTQQMPYSVKKFAGSGGLGYGLKQYFVEQYHSAIKKHYTYSLAECYDEMKKFYEQNGTLIGSSAAANLLAAKDIAVKLGKGKTVITLFPSLASKSEYEELGII